MLHIVMIFFMTSALNQDLTYTYTKKATGINTLNIQTMIFRMS
ncbi:MAG: hypothetical protein UZ08_BCD001000115 [Candidatus Parvibacillus calidus]|nr:MAG: hypothetical protein UZ08_BCD001000115 [Candidatus Parvibacillus calidus]